MIIRPHVKMRVVKLKQTLSYCDAGQSTSMWIRNVSLNMRLQANTDVYIKTSVASRADIQHSRNQLLVQLRRKTTPQLSLTSWLNMQLSHKEGW